MKIFDGFKTAFPISSFTAGVNLSTLVTKEVIFDGIKTAVTGIGIASFPISSSAAGIDLSTLVTKIDDQVPGLTGVGVSVTGLVIIVTLFGLAFVLLRGR